MSKLNLEMPDQLMLAFRQLVLAKYGSLKGGMAKEMEIAIREHLKRNGIEIGESGNCNAIPVLA